MDPKIQSILASYENEEEEKEVSEEEITFPQTADEWIEKMGYTIWPMTVEEERRLNLTPEDVGTGSLEDIMNDLAAHAPLDLSVMDDVLKQIEQLESKVNVFASKILNVHATEPQEDEVEAKTRAETPPLVRRYRNDEETILENTRKSRERAMKSQKTKSVENTAYFGFISNELTPLPGQLETLQLLNKITKIQNFSGHFKVMWKKTILSEASVAVFQDAFWWFFCHNFQRNQPVDAIFSRISDSFIALFFSIPAGFKDQFFQHYPNCLAQVLLAAFCEAFPDSYKLFDDEFKSSLLDTTCEWVWGLKPPPLSWRHWKLDELEPSEIRKSQQNPDTLHMNLSFDMESILGEHAQSPSDRSRLGRSPSRSLQPGPSNEQESHPVAAGPHFAKVQFDILGQSPLVSHFLSVKGLKACDIGKVKRTVGRTEIARLPVATPTYRDIIDECKRNSHILSQQYRVVLQMSAEESQRIQQQKRQVLAKINQLENELTRKHSDFKILSEKIYDVVLHSDYTS